MRPPLDLRPAPLRTGEIWCMTLLLAGLVAVALLLDAGCTALPPPECPLGAIPSGVDQDASASGTASASASVLTQSGKGTGSGSATRSIDYSCKRICPKDQLLKASRERTGAGLKESIECLAGVLAGPLAPPAKAPGIGTSSLPPQVP